jgi:FkbM family methyltransferase
MAHFNLHFFTEQLHKRKKDIFFVQIGAMDGKTFDPIYEFVQKYGWNGVLVEPLKDHFESLKQNYSNSEGLIFENVAITEESGTRKINRIPTKVVNDNDLPNWGLGASSFYTDRNALEWDEIKPHIVREEVDCLTLPELLNKHNITEIDVLQIDAEGYDYHILKQLDFDKFHPYIINLEIVNLPKSERNECRKLLDKYNYLHIKAGYNLLAVSLPV